MTTPLPAKPGPQPTGCKLSDVLKLIWALMIAIGAALIASLLGPPGWAVALGIAVAAIVIVKSIQKDFAIYKRCLDRAMATECPDTSIQNHFGGLLTLLGIAASSLTLALAEIWLPVIGPFLAGGSLVVAQAALGLAMGLAMSLLSFAQNYRECRDPAWNQPTPAPLPASSQ